jgi:hypothetical protein
MSDDGSRADYYRERAADVRDIAGGCKDVLIKQQLEKIAQEYESLANLVNRGMLSH